MHYSLALSNSFNDVNFSQLCQWVCVDIAANEHGIKGRKTNISRISLVAGLDRKEVKCITELESEEVDQIGKQADRLSKILSHWFDASDYTDAAGRPLELMFEGDDMKWSNNEKFKQPSVIYTWQDRMLYIGGLHSDIRSYTSNVCLFGLSLYSDIKINTGGKTIKTSSFILLSNTLHQITYDPQDVIVWVLIEPSHTHCEHVQAMMTQKFHHCFFDLVDVDKIKNTFLDIYQFQPESREVCRMVSAALSLEGKSFDDGYVKDTRVLQIMDRINKDIDRNIPSAELASEVGLSDGRLQQLFKQKAKMSIRKYRLWQRLKYACEISENESRLSDVARLSGFSDVAHFSRSFRDTFGKTASSFIGVSSGVNFIQ